MAASYYGGRPYVLVIDIATPSKPRPIPPHAIAPFPGRAVDVQLDGDVLFVAAEGGGLAAFDVHDPANPVYLGMVQTRFAQKVDVCDGLVYVADDVGGLVVVDASDPQNMIVLAYCDTPGRAFGVAASGGHVFVADGVEGMQVVSLSALTPTATPTVTPIPTPTSTPTPLPLVFPLILRGQS